MASESSHHPQRARGDRTPLVVLWILGLVATVEIVLAAIALAPRFVAAVRSNAPRDRTPLAGTPRTIPEATSAALENQSGLNPQMPADPGVGEVRSREVTPSGTFHQGSRNPETADVAMSIVNAKLEGTGDASRKLTVAIKARPGESVDVAQVKVQVYFYDSSDGEIIPSKAQVTSNWLSLPVSWKGGGPEILEINYVMDSADLGVSFGGYVVAVYYKGELQDYRAEPSKLTKLFPLKYFIGTDES